MSVSLTDSLTELERLLLPHPVVATQLRPPVSHGQVQDALSPLGIGVPSALLDLYGWHEGTSPKNPDQRPVCLFPKFWQFMFLEWVVNEAKFPMEWCREIGVEGIPFAKRETGDFLVMQDGPGGFVWLSSYDGVSPFGPDGTLVGLINDTCRALRGEHAEFVAVFDQTGMDWISPSEAEEAVRA